MKYLLKDDEQDGACTLHVVGQKPSPYKTV